MVDIHRANNYSNIEVHGHRKTDYSRFHQTVTAAVFYIEYILHFPFVYYSPFNTLVKTYMAKLALKNVR